MHYRSALVDGAREELIELATELARLVIGNEPSTRPDVIARWASDLLDRTRRARTAVLTVNPRDEPSARQALEQLEATRPWLQSLSVRADPEVGRGGCVVHTDLGRLDARVEVRLAALAGALTSVTGDCTRLPARPRQPSDHRLNTSGEREPDSEPPHTVT